MGKRGEGVYPEIVHCMTIDRDPDTLEAHQVTQRAEVVKGEFTV